MELAAIFDQYRDRLITDSRFQRSATHLEQKRTISAIVFCRTAMCGEIKVYCPDCNQVSWFYHSCGHRSCPKCFPINVKGTRRPKCQNPETSRWLDRQRAKLLPVVYFLVTFTLPAELRLFARLFP